MGIPCTPLGLEDGLGAEGIKTAISGASRYRGCPPPLVPGSAVDQYRPDAVVIPPGHPRVTGCATRGKVEGSRTRCFQRLMEGICGVVQGKIGDIRWGLEGLPVTRPLEGCNSPAGQAARMVLRGSLWDRSQHKKVVNPHVWSSREGGGVEGRVTNKQVQDRGSTSVGMEPGGQSRRTQQGEVRRIQHYLE